MENGIFALKIHWTKTRGSSINDVKCIVLTSCHECMFSRHKILISLLFKGVLSVLESLFRELNRWWFLKRVCRSCSIKVHVKKFQFIFAKHFSFKFFLHQSVHKVFFNNFPFRSYSSPSDLTKHLIQNTNVGLKIQSILDGWRKILFKMITWWRLSKTWKF